jgi:hypothetical protein
MGVKIRDHENVKKIILLIVLILILFYSIGHIRISLGYIGSSSEIGYNNNFIEEFLFKFYSGAVICFPFIFQASSIWFFYAERKKISFKRFAIFFLISFYILSLAYNASCDYFYKSWREPAINNFHEENFEESIIRNEISGTKSSVFSFIPFYSHYLHIEEDKYIQTVITYITASRFSIKEGDKEIYYYLENIQDKTKKRLAERMISRYEESKNDFFKNVVILLSEDHLPPHEGHLSLLPLYVFSFSLLISIFLSRSDKK